MTDNLTCDACLNGKHMRCFGCACWSCNTTRGRREAGLPARRRGVNDNDKKQRYQDKGFVGEHDGAWGIARDMLAKGCDYEEIMDSTRMSWEYVFSADHGHSSEVSCGAEWCRHVPRQA